MMAVSLKRKLWLAVVVLLVTVPIDTMVLFAFSRPTIGDRARHWAFALSDEERSELLRHARLPIAYYRAVKYTLGRTGATRLMLDKVADYRRQHPALPKEKDEFLTRWTNLLNANRVYGTAPDVLTQEQLFTLAGEAKRLFPDMVDHAALFLMDQKRVDATGAAEPGLQNRLAAYLVQLFQSRSALAAEARDEAECSCSAAPGQDYCDWFWHTGGHCCTGEACSPSVFDYEDLEWVPACGTFGGYPCDGDCVLPM
jgi:hypothetical protein